MTPNYMQVRGLAPRARRDVRHWHLREVVRGRPAGAGRPISTSCDALVTRRRARSCSAIPTTRPARGSTAADARRDLRDRRRARRVGGDDEIYRGAEREADETPTVWGRYERAIVTSGPVEGVRPARACGSAGSSRRRRSSPTCGRSTTTRRSHRAAINDRLARIALAPARRELAARADARHHPRELSDRSSAGSSGRTALSHIAPEAGAIVFVRHTHPIALVGADRAPARRAQRPGRSGDYFDMDGYFRDRVRLRSGATRVRAVADWRVLDSMDAGPRAHAR